MSRLVRVPSEGPIFEWRVVVSTGDNDRAEYLCSRRFTSFGDAVRYARQCDQSRKPRIYRLHAYTMAPGDVYSAFPFAPIPTVNPLED